MDAFAAIECARLLGLLSRPEINESCSLRPSCLIVDQDADSHRLYTVVLEHSSDRLLIRVTQVANENGVLSRASLRRRVCAAQLHSGLATVAALLLLSVPATVAVALIATSAAITTLGPSIALGVVSVALVSTSSTVTTSVAAARVASTIAASHLRRSVSVLVFLQLRQLDGSCKLEINSSLFVFMNEYVLDAVRQVFWNIEDSAGHILEGTHTLDLGGNGLGTVLADEIPYE